MALTRNPVFAVLSMRHQGCCQVPLLQEWRVLACSAVPTVERLAIENRTSPSCVLIRSVQVATVVEQARTQLLCTSSNVGTRDHRLKCRAVVEPCKRPIVRAPFLTCCSRASASDSPSETDHNAHCQCRGVLFPPHDMRTTSANSRISRSDASVIVCPASSSPFHSSRLHSI
eukprot:scaffold49_cov409-Prasinococcus_capsulatus_cf.AAC.9